MKLFQKIITSVILSCLIVTSLSPISLASSTSNNSNAKIYTYNDGFSSYEVGSDGSPNWVNDEMSWGIKNQYLYNDAIKKSFSRLNTPEVYEMTFESEVNIENSKVDTYKVAGISVYDDSKNYWHLVLSEAPETKGKKHFVELAEMYNGKWNAQGAGDTKLSISSSYDDNFTWEYKHTYLLKISLTSNSITGSVYELDGTLKWKRKYNLSVTNSVYKGTPALTTEAFNTIFDNVKVTSSNRIDVNKISSDTKSMKTNNLNEKYPAFTVETNPDITGKKTGYFHTEEINGKWWTIAPDGNAFFAIGTGQVTYQGFYSQELGYSPYGQNTKALYGSEEEWAETTADRLKEWGFNLLGINSNENLRYQGLAHTGYFGFSTKFCNYGEDYAIYPSDNNGHTFPNVFSPKFKYYCEDLARQITEDNQDDPWLFGYYLDNELAWWGKNYNTAYGLTDLVIEKENT
ncbi:hypothetical protein, partial [Dehalobacter sp.]|uniref:hypothetical protein n=1 Tax=Dehalobacter sp. TaxID=1962289 RepID=UPI00258C2368